MAGVKPLAVILAGGRGERFWPLSQKNLPKQYLNLVSDRSLIQLTVSRLAPLVTQDRISICSAKNQEKLLREQLPEIRNLILEPEGRNTAACLILSVTQLLRDGHKPGTPMMVFPADHYIADVGAFHTALTSALAAAKTGSLVTLGIHPESPHTGYGYIEAGDPFPSVPGVSYVQRFVEKPDRAKAESFLRQGGFFWNSGIFIWTLQAISEAFQKWMPFEWDAIQSCRNEKELNATYRKLTSTPIDIGVMEKARNVLVVPSQMGWSDIGSWDALYQLKARQAGENVILEGKVAAPQSQGCLVKVPAGKQVALIGVENLVVVESGNQLLIVSRSNDQLVREATKLLE
jgi:mannose-1-phosphate guanylyltransferase